MKRQSAILGILTLAILLQVLFPMPALCAGMVEIVEALPTPVPTASPAPVDRANRTPAPSDPNAGPMKDQPASVSGNLRLYTKSTLESDLRLNARTLSIPVDGAPVPRLYQYNYTTPVCSNHGKPRSAKTSGCGAAVISMIDAYVNKNLDQTPYTVLYEAAESGVYIGQGFDFFALQALLKARGIEVSYVPRSEDSMRAALEDGNVLILCMGPGEFTNNGHYILVRGLDEEGALVNDPNDEVHSFKHYSLRQLNRESKVGYMLLITSKPKNK